jgi:hypothetical protein
LYGATSRTENAAPGGDLSGHMYMWSTVLRRSGPAGKTWRRRSGRSVRRPAVGKTAPPGPQDQQGGGVHLDWGPCLRIGRIVRTGRIRPTRRLSKAGAQTPTTPATASRDPPYPGSTERHLPEPPGEARRSR